MDAAFANAFAEADFRRRAMARLLASEPPEGLDPARPALRSDDDLNRDWPAIDAAAAPRRAAVLVGLVRREPELTLLLTQRTEHLARHPGQVAFPGGSIDEADAGAVATALRETEEETGIAPRFVEPVGYLDAYQTRTGFRVVPVVALIAPGFSLQPHPGEVADVFEVPLSFVMDPANHLLHSRLWQGAARQFYAMPYGERYIWGATAGMLRNLYERMYAP